MSKYTVSINAYARPIERKEIYAEDGITIKLNVKANSKRQAMENICKILQNIIDASEQAHTADDLL